MLDTGNLFSYISIKRAVGASFSRSLSLAHLESSPSSHTYIDFASFIHTFGKYS